MFMVWVLCLLKMIDLIFAGSGVSTDIWTSYAARIMIISLIPFIVVQIPEVFQATSQSRLAIMISLIVSICLLLAYSLYQVLNDS